MPGIPDHILDQVRQANDVVDVIGGYFPLKRRGANFIALCPFHKEKTPSFNVNPSRQIWHCFGCGAGGDVFKFVMQHENLPFVETVQKLADRAGIRLEFETAPGAPTRDEKDALYKLHEAVTAFYHQNLLTDPAATPGRAYLEKRAIPLATAKRWRLGYSPAGWDGLLQWARAKKFNVALLETAGLVLRRERGEGWYDRFRGRLMFPICDDQGRVVGFSARLLTDEQDQPKYVNSPETPIFQKGRLLFALDRAKKPIHDERHVIVCEGQLDTITCHEAGFTNVIAPQGTAFTEHHARMIKRHTDEVILMFDGDNAGQKAAVRNADPLWELGIGIRVAFLPAGHDPDSFLKEHGAPALRELLANAPSFFDFLLRRLTAEHDPRTERGKRELAAAMVPWLCRLRDPILQGTFTQRTAARLEVPEEVVRQAMKNFTRHGPRPRDEEPESPPPGEPARPRGLPAELELLRLLLLDERILESVAEHLDRMWLSDSLAGDLIARSVDLFVARAWTGTGTLLNDATDEEQRLVSGLLLEAPTKGEPATAATDCLARLEHDFLRQEQARVRRRLAEPDLPAAELAALLQQNLDLRKRLDNIAALPRTSSQPTQH